jgi:hypothetical protein
MRLLGTVAARMKILAILLALTSCSWMGGDDGGYNYHWQSVSDRKGDARAEQERMERDLSQCVAQAHGFTIEADQCMQGRGYEKHFDR